MESRTWLSQKEAAEHFGVLPITIRRWRDNGEIDTTKVKKKTLYNIDSYKGKKHHKSIEPEPEAPNDELAEIKQRGVMARAKAEELNANTALEEAEGKRDKPKIIAFKEQELEAKESTLLIREEDLTAREEAVSRKILEITVAVGELKTREEMLNQKEERLKREEMKSKAEWNKRINQYNEAVEEYKDKMATLKTNPAEASEIASSLKEVE